MFLEEWQGSIFRVSILLVLFLNIVLSYINLIIINASDRLPLPHGFASLIAMLLLPIRSFGQARCVTPNLFGSLWELIWLKFFMIEIFRVIIPSAMTTALASVNAFGARRCRACLFLKRHFPWQKSRCRF